MVNRDLGWRKEERRKRKDGELMWEVESGEWESKLLSTFYDSYSQIRSPVTSLVVESLRRDKKTKREFGFMPAMLPLRFRVWLSVSKRTSTVPDLTYVSVTGS